MHVSPGKRRALAPLDNNSRSPIPSLKLSQPPECKTLSSHDVQDPDGSNGGKRKSAAVEDGPDAVKKRQCGAAASMAMTATDDSPSGPVTRDRDACSISPEPSSIFDNATGDTSLATCTTEVETDTDVLAASPPRLPRQPTMTRAEARQHAEVLRLRLGLAGYKLRTGQEDLPFERLQIRRGMVRSGRNLDGHVATPPMLGTASQFSHGEETEPLGRLHTPARAQPDDNQGTDFTIRAIEGGVADGLISLSRG